MLHMMPNLQNAQPVTLANLEYALIPEEERRAIVPASPPAVRAMVQAHARLQEIANELDRQAQDLDRREERIAQRERQLDERERTLSTCEALRPILAVKRPLVGRVSSCLARVTSALFPTGSRGGST